uniref:Tubulin--tyrosine ligase-like protein 12 SET-like domain-containing protein n=1 Tax=Chenopodium quinoa TaxID=63459 RepID=A0A803MG33_CHEQI
MVEIKNYNDFLQVHSMLLAATGLPQPLYPQLFRKLSSETFDAGEFFQIEPSEDGRQRKLIQTSDFMPKNSNVFLVDHAWTFRLSDAPKQLEEVPGLVERMASLMCVDADCHADGGDGNEDLDNKNGKMTAEEILEIEICRAKESGNDGVQWLELEEFDIDDAKLLALDLPTKCPVVLALLPLYLSNLVALSLLGNKIEKLETVLEEISKLKNLRALWLNDNHVLKNCASNMEEAVLQAFPKLEIFNSHFTCNYGEWALGFCGEIYGKDNPGNDGEEQQPNITSLDLSDRCIHNLNNKALSPLKLPHLSHLNIRGNPIEENSVPELLEILKNFPSLNSLEVDIPGPLGESALEILDSLPNLFLLNGTKATKIFDMDKHVVDSVLQPRLPEWNPDDPLADRVLNAMWLYLMTYRLADEEKIDETSVCYVMDELGSALRHSDVPNFQVAPFLYMRDGNLSSAVSFSILWPTQDVEKGDECTRDFLLGIGEDKQRSARLSAWFHTPKNYFIKGYEKYHQKLQSKRFTPPSMGSLKPSSLLCNQNPLQVYTDIPHVQEFLTRPEFAITCEPKEADILWTSMQVDEETKKAVGIRDDQYINQFPHEACLVMKHHLAETMQEAHGTPEWLQPTYDLESHLTELIGDYYVREREGLDNLWILKPWNMARTIDTTITSNLSAIIRLMETGPKICQKYIEHPSLFRGKKFDLRYIVLVRSINPLDIFLANVFWVRLSNNAYSLDERSLYEYETHFTVMNYRGVLNHLQTQEFVKEFEQEHQVKWLDIHQRIRNMIRSVFEAAVAVHPEMHSPKSRAIYGVDVMLDSSFCPKLLEVTYCPDCSRACTYDMEPVFGEGAEVKGRDFFNNVFGCLFLNETTNVTPL